MSDKPFESLVQTTLPTDFGVFNIKAYESDVSSFPHLALFTDSYNTNEVVDVRIHSECMTGDVFSSSKCDCGEQLDYSMKWMQDNQGIIIYLRQEGRGIGLVKKLEAYNLQDEGYNTIEANLKLGFHADQRNFDIAISILKELKVEKIRLLTNNPEKLKVFEGSGISVLDRIPIEIEPNDSNVGYLKTKKEEMGHFLSNLL